MYFPWLNIKFSSSILHQAGTCQSCQSTGVKVGKRKVIWKVHNIGQLEQLLLLLPTAINSK